MRFLVTACLMLMGFSLQSSAMAAPWMEVKTPHFILYGKQSDKELTRLATRLELANMLLHTVLPMASPLVEDKEERPLLVYVVPPSEVKDLSGISTAAGFYNDDERNGYAVVGQGQSANKYMLNQETVLFHEFAHHFMLAKTHAAYPAWYVEGFAEFFSTLKFGDNGEVQFGNIPMVRVPQLVMEELYPLDKLMRNAPRGLGLAEGDRYYGASWLLTHFLVFNDARGKEFQAYVRDLASPSDARDVESYFNGGFKALDKELKAYKKSRLKAFSVTLTLPPEAAPKLRALSEEERTAILLELQLKAHKSEKDHVEMAADGRKAVAQFPRSAAVHAVLARIMVDQKNWDEALTEADAAIALDPNRSDAHAARAVVLLQRAEDSAGYREAARAIAAANRADLHDPYPLFLYYRLMRERGETSEVAFDGLSKAFSQVPQRSAYRWAYADALAQRKDYARAITVITPLANDRHGGNSALAAQKLRDRFIAMRDGKPVERRAETQEADDAAPE
ncbi:MAG: tetratricopeptide repeat protein [Sphingobium sp.]